MRFRRSLVLPIFLTAVVAAAAWAGPLEDGLAAYDKGRWNDAVRLLTPLAEQGNPQAEEKLGRLYQRGKGVTRDYVIAENWYRKAAEQGDAVAQARLGFMLRLGVAGTRDYGAALKWYRLSAGQGNALGQVGLGYMLLEGVAVPIDHKTAADWFRKAALQGDALAMLELGTLYESGRGVPQDYAQAWAWYMRATKDDGEYEQDVFDRAGHSRDTLAARMTPDQIEQARKLATEP
jgi:TPR repeat protein